MNSFSAISGPYILRRLLIVFLLLFSAISLFSNYRVELRGDGYTGRVKHRISEDIAVIVTDSSGNPQPGITVEFISTNDQIKIIHPLTETNRNGEALTGIEFGKEMGNYRIDTIIHLPEESIKKSLTLTALDYKKLFFFLIGGLGLFLFGIRKISESLRIIGGDNLKKILSKLTANRFWGIGVGLTITALLQSSSATTVMTIGFVNASLLTLRQAISIIIGANIGTTVTAQIIAFKIGDFALPAIALGAAIVIFSKKLRMRSYGSIIFGFGLVFFGLSLMTDIVTPIRHSAFLSDLFVNFSHNYFLAIIAGTLMTMLVQSSSATVGITMVLAVSGLIDIKAAMALVLGDNIGTTITAVLASLGSSVNARRTAISHVIFNSFGAMYMLLLIVFFGDQVALIVTRIGGNIARQVANFHTLFNVFNMLLFIPLIPLLEKITLKLIPETSAKTKGVTVYINDSLLEEPSIAIDQIKLELGRMMQNVRQVIACSIKSLESINRIYINDTYQAEDENDQFQLEITDYIARLSRKELEDDDAARLPVLLHLTNDLEKAADFARNIAEIAERKLDKGVEFNEKQKESIATMKELLDSILDNLLLALENNDQVKARYVAKQEIKMNHFEVLYKKEQIREISMGVPVEPAIMTMDIITNIEKIGDHLYNVAQAVMGALSEDKKALYSDLLINTTLKGSCCQ
ncbi:MAG: Na/Pi symporter [Candidatus Cloacimonetes bacterium]|nr:Na/Pi symporter [Candidatus Cloacimonadota bacterium]